MPSADRLIADHAARALPESPCLPFSRELLALTLISGVGPVRMARLLTVFGSPGDVLRASPTRLETVHGVGPALARSIAESRNDALSDADAEIDLARTLNVRMIARGDADYPALLRPLPDAPPMLYIRGELHPDSLDRFPLAMVGSRTCTHYGMEQTERFAGSLAQAGLTIVSGGARGIDTAAHRAAMRLNGRTIAVLGCGLAHCYPQENAELFDQIASGRGAVISELPLTTPPAAENFPARNRIISGLSLGVLVVEAARGSGSLITAKIATEDHGREVFAIPSRVDSKAAEGSLDLLKRGGAHLVTDPADVLDLLGQSARHAAGGTHAARYTSAQSLWNDDQPAAAIATPSAAGEVRQAALSNGQRALLAALREPMSIDDLVRVTGEPVHALRADLTMLEIRRCIRREGSGFVARDGQAD